MKQNSSCPLTKLFTVSDAHTVAFEKVVILETMVITHSFQDVALWSRSNRNLIARMRFRNGIYALTYRDDHLIIGDIEGFVKKFHLFENVLASQCSLCLQSVDVSTKYF